MKNRPKVGLALGAGASRGFAHIGVLQVLEENDIYPDYIAGSSIGAIVGALYASGIKPDVMGGIAANLDLRICYDIGMPKMGFIKGEKIEELIRILTKGKSFHELDPPLRVTAVDLKTSKSVIFDQGLVYKAVRASISIPGIFVPVIDGDRVLVDGGLLERLPTGVVRDMGADVIIGVDVGFMGIHGEASNILGIILQSFEVMELAIADNSFCNGDILIYPDLAHINPLNFDKAEECIEEGRRVALQHIDKIKEKIYKREIKLSEDRG